MIRLWLKFASLCLVAAPAYAAVDCHVGQRIIQIHTALVHLQSNPPRWVAIDNLHFLQTEVARTNDATVSAAFAELDDAYTFVVLRDFMQRLSETTQMNTNGPRRLISELQSPEWRATLDRVDERLKSLPCGAQGKGDTGADTGRDVPTEDITDETQEVQRYGIDRLAEKMAIGTALMVATGGLALWVLPILRRRKHLKVRRAKRFTVAIETTFKTDTTDTRAEIVNLSCTGAKFRYWADAPIEVRTQGSLQVADQSVAGNVVWSNNLYAGLQFAAPMPVDLVRQLANAPRFDALGRALGKK